MAIAIKKERITAPPGSDLRQLEIQFNNLLTDMANIAGGTGPLTPAVLSIGTTVTLATSASTIQIAGVPSAVAALPAQALGALGTIPASKWGLITAERVAAGTETFVSAAANYTTGYNSEALALAAMPAISAGKVRVGWFTVLASASGWVAGTDALAGGVGGNPATTTNYTSAGTLTDSSTGQMTANQIGNQQGVALSSANY